MTLNPSHAHDLCAHEPEARALLLALLSSLACYRQTPLDFDIDYHAIVTTACRELGFAEPPQPAAFDHLINQALGLPPLDHPRAHALTPWVKQLSQTIRPVDPMATDILRLALDGCLLREIADRLDLGPLLVQRILADIAAAWQNGRAT